MYIYTCKDVLELAGSSGAAWKSDKQARGVFFRTPLDEKITNTYFLVSFYCSGKKLHCLEISGSKNNLRII